MNIIKKINVEKVLLNLLPKKTTFLKNKDLRMIFIDVLSTFAKT